METTTYKSKVMNNSKEEIYMNGAQLNEMNSL